MASLHFQYFTVRDSASGEFFYKGTEVPLRKVLEALADGVSNDDIIKNFPALRPVDLTATIAWSAFVALDELPSERSGKMPVFD